MSLTAEQWKKLDESRRAYVAAQDAFNGGDRTPERYAECDRLEGVYFPLLYDLAPALIDAARPKCETCDGNGRDYGSEWNTRVCPDCDGTGYAA